jgi:cell wall-associated NlpC family hydrolase
VLPAARPAVLPAAPRVAQPVAAPARRPGRDRLERRLRVAWERLERVIEQHNAIRDELRRNRSRSAALAGRLGPLRAEMRGRTARVGGMAAQAYRAGGAVEVSRLLAATSPEQFAARLMILRRLTGEQTRALGALTETRHRYEATRATLARLAGRQRHHERRLAEQRRRIRADIARLERALGGRPFSVGGRAPRDGYVPTYAPGRAGLAVRFAYGQLGKPYRWGGSGPGGYDCSGLTSAAWARAGVTLPHNSAAQWRAVHPISRAELRQGDLVFYYADIHHVALYVGGDRVVHAPNHGERVRVERMGYAPIYGYGRV